MKNLLFALLFLTACSGVKSKYPTVTIDTDYGDIVAEIYTDKAPLTSKAFLENVNKGVYNNSSFYRSVQDATQSSDYVKGVIQGGVHKVNPSLAASLPRIAHESPTQTGLSHKDGTLSMARLEAGSASGEFFICVGDQSAYDNSKRLQADGLGYAAFGKVIKGMDVVRRILGKSDGAEGFTTEIKIRDIKEN